MYDRFNIFPLQIIFFSTNTKIKKEVRARGAAAIRRTPDQSFSLRSSGQLERSEKEQLPPENMRTKCAHIFRGAVPPRRGVRTASEVLFFRSESGEILESDGKVFDIHHFQEVESFACERETDAFDFDGISDLTIAAFMALPLPVIFAR